MLGKQNQPSYGLQLHCGLCVLALIRFADTLLTARRLSALSTHSSWPQEETLGQLDKPADANQSHGFLALMLLTAADG